MIARLLLLATLGGVAGCGTDPPLDVAQGVDLSRFQGKWYEVARLPRVTQTDCYGTTAFYTQKSDGTLELVNQCNVGGTAGPLKTVTMNATVPDTAAPAKLAVDVGGYSGDYWILEVGSNYEYAVIGHPSRAYFWILSRTPMLDDGTVQGVLDRARHNQFDTSRLQYTPQPPAGERSSSNVPQGQVPPPQSYGCSMMRMPASDAGVWGAALVVAGLVRLRTRRTTSPRPSSAKPAGSSP